MAFSKEDRKKVFDFFVELLMKNHEPIYYEHLRGHVAQAAPVIRKYVSKECKGEKLLDYFQTRKNYFYVEKDKVILLTNKKKCSNGMISKEDKLITKQKTTSSDAVSYEVTSSNFECSRSDSVSSRYGSTSSSVDDIYVDADINEKTRYEKDAIEYFSNYLKEMKELNLNTLEMKCLPENIEYYVSKYLNSNIVLLFKNNSKIFCFNDKNSVLLVDSSVPVEISENLLHDSALGIRRKSSVEDIEIGSLDNLIQCAEFFFSVLKNKRLPLSYISGHLSHASPDVKQYLKLHYTTFKDFLIHADQLFIFYDDEVAVTKNGPKLLKNAKKLLYAEFKSNISTQSLKCLVYSQLSTKQNLLANINQSDSCSNVKDLEISITENLKEDVLYSGKDQKLIIEEHNIPGNENISNGNKNSNKSDLHSARNKKCSISDDKNINVGNVNCNKETEDKSKNESLCSKSVINEKKIFKFEDQDIVDSAVNVAEILEIPPNSAGECLLEKIERKNQTRRNFIECVFTIQLLCLEIVEKDRILCLKYEYEAVKFFVETLEKLPGRMGDCTSLRGCLGQASKDINFFMNNFYKRDKISQFFEKYKEFHLGSRFIVKLASDYKNHLGDHRKLHKLFIDNCKIYNVYNLYNLYLHNTFIDVLECLTKFCKFLSDKSRIKLSRLNGAFSKLFPSQPRFINSFNGTADEKLRSFLCYFSFFDFSNGCIEFDSELSLDTTLLINLLSEFTQKLNKLNVSCDFDETKLPYSDYLLDYLCENEYTVMDLDELKTNVIEGVQTILSYGPLDYSTLPNIVGYEVLHNTVLKKKDSQFFIQLLEESNLFLVNDGKISHKQDNETVAFNQDSNSSDEICYKDSESEKTEVSSIDKTHREDLEIALSKKSPVIENDMCANLEESKTFNEKLVNDEADIVSLYKNDFSDELQNKQNDLNHEGKSLNMLVSSTIDQYKTKEDHEINIQDTYNPSDILSTEQTFINLETGNNLSCDTILNAQQGDICVSGSYSISNESKETVKNLINESNGKKFAESIDLENKQDSESDIETNFIMSNQEISKSSCISSIFDESLKLHENQSEISANVTAFDLIKENNTSEINKQVVPVNNTNLNCVENISAPENINENVENLSFPCVVNFIEEQFENSSHCDDSLVKNSNTFGTIKSLSDVNFESNQSGDKAVQSKISKTGNELPTNHTLNGSSLPKKDSTGSGSEGDRPQFNFDSNALQPLQAKLIVLTLDSCIAETCINGQKKCLFCLKSCFRCDLHTYCCDCFNLLIVGDEILCYIPPTEDLNCGNMCFAFMFHKDVEDKNKSIGFIDTDGCQRNESNQIISKKLSCSENGGICDEDYPQYLQSTDDELQTVLFDKVKFNSEMDEKKRQVESTIASQNVQMQSSVISQSTQIQFPTVSQSTEVKSSTVSQSAQVQPSVISQNTQTIELPVKKYGIEKECQVTCSSVSQITQTAIVTSEVKSQTVLVGEVKTCFPVCEKACLTKFPTLSQNTQTFSKSFDKGSQTNISGNINPQYDSSSCECQTTFTGEIQGYASFSDQYCQTDKTTQTETERDAEKTTQKETNFESTPLTIDNIACDVDTGARSKYSSRGVQKAFCDTACQTLSTGPIMLKKLYQLD